MLMKKSLRLCLAVLLVGLSLLSVTLVRVNSVPIRVNFDNEEEGATCGWDLYSGFLMFDRAFSVSIMANDTVSVYVLDEAGVKLWNANNVVDAVWVYEDVVDGVFSERSAGRGGYAVLVYLPEDSVTAVKVVFTFSGFEKDLLFVSLAVVGVGMFSLGVMFIFNVRNKKQKCEGNYL
jgi:hypothetical protein